MNVPFPPVSSCERFAAGPAGRAGVPTAAVGLPPAPGDAPPPLLEQPALVASATHTTSATPIGARGTHRSRRVARTRGFEEASPKKITIGYRQL
ncbi:hypothetical protein [Candidatus Frankia alpina]|uniref:Uncharacterized protein n=1 Tax=Candidatus Frankia alpina TaxID=2699483 RepID=A0A4S5ETE3_9ACTN|nr:hypothetical protein [Candidatus Frankia alpina]THJ75777.1 hypothetical protein E7Y31_03475 [Candidatus Frankia alpina]